MIEVSSALYLLICASVLAIAPFWFSICIFNFVASDELSPSALAVISYCFSNCESIVFCCGSVLLSCAILASSPVADFDQLSRPAVAALNSALASEIDLFASCIPAFNCDMSTFHFIVDSLSGICTTP